MPQSDRNAPERPNSAYVLLSNSTSPVPFIENQYLELPEIRDDLKSENLSYAELAKRVGYIWQGLTAEERESYESQASAAREKYKAQLSDYQNTKECREYQLYLNVSTQNSSDSEAESEPVHAQNFLRRRERIKDYGHSYSCSCKTCTMLDFKPPGSTGMVSLTDGVGVNGENMADLREQQPVWIRKLAKFCAHITASPKALGS